ncbi:Alpha-ketoglutarate-dependent dioxygenase alkB [Babesia bigemina]|uniref:Alpha-ketoglutarate-dependent dioxygenase alkB n=1 Tax=Babesia bigemina TaxID=5866 RepID=A0A061DCC7_BABBI|nr:Alpha-ketoglutarate-dependent dioxygenase alkB [Babesia bigemina]CDR95475.1 Alpha-ketoglutarate-dependent dioxygenase alkB [Babesia bigemina]|eukprot:XP_012767661.1 Alpha-ketoglutarate-dependent dioxygenase alkB [Babesia bigemina]
MYEENAVRSHSNAVFNEIRNTPLESLNTQTFRSSIAAAIRLSSEGAADDDASGNQRLQEALRIAGIYKVHFLPPCSDLHHAGQATVYTFDGFPGIATRSTTRCITGLYLVRNYLTEAQCERLMCRTLTEYINVSCDCHSITHAQPPNNSNIYQNDRALCTPIWPSANFKKLRWATIGHMYDWGTRSYRGYSAFPEPLVKITQSLLSHFNREYVPDAAIINCYTKGYFLRLHKDDAEETDDTVVNISLGAPAIFTIGGRDYRNSTIPVAMVVDSGSVVLMAEDSRFCLHGVVKLLGYNKPGRHDCDAGGTSDVGDSAYAAPRLSMVIPRCGDDATASLECDPESLDSVKRLFADHRVSISIRRAKR